VAEEIPHRLVRVLRGVPDLDGIDDDSLLGLVGASANLVWAEGAQVFAIDTPARAMYLVLSGAVDIVDRDGSVVRTAGPGEYIGERALARDDLHSKSARAATRCELMVVPKAPLVDLLAAHPALAEQVRARLARPSPRETDRG